jgi:hypothetical protein
MRSAEVEKKRGAATARAPLIKVVRSMVSDFAGRIGFEKGGLVVICAWCGGVIAFEVLELGPG